MGKKVKRIEWWSILWFDVVFLVLPTILFLLIAREYPAFLRIAYFLLVWMFIIQATMLYISDIVALPRRRFKEPATPPGEIPPIPRTTFIVSSYLPNEVNVIEDTLVNLLQNIQRPPGDIEVICAYNSEYLVGIEQRLQALAAKWPELILANAYESRSKSENINYALNLASGEMVVLLDADHQPSPDCIARAWRWLAAGFDCVQGRCKIRNGDENLLTSLIEVEFEGIYAVSHQSRSLMFHSALFGGSNGYWRKTTLKQLGFHTDMLTEDIDLTLRATLAGCRMVHDRSIVSTELAPSSLTDWWFQRKRWAQGWFQCSLRHTVAVLRSRTLTIGPKFSWMWLLAWRLIYDSFSHLLFPVVFAYWFWRAEIVFPMPAFTWFALIYTFFSGPFEALVAYVSAVKPRFPFRRIVLYSVIAFGYVMIKNMIQMIAIRDDLKGRREWVSTPH